GCRGSGALLLAGEVRYPFAGVVRDIGRDPVGLSRHRHAVIAQGPTATEAAGRGHRLRRHEWLRINNSSVSRMRLSPRARPSGRTHSWDVWAPPPIPPAPIAIAGIPSERGTLASVEEVSRCERIPRCASTARMYCKIGAVSASAAAGRDPISFSLADTLPPF